MNLTQNEYCLEVSGPFALFTRPEFKAEPVSYEIPTPSAVRAIFECILMQKGAFAWQPTRIEVLNPISWQRIKRCDVGYKPTLKFLKPFCVEDKRELRHSLFLRDVRYRLFAKQVFIPLSQRSDADMARIRAVDETPAKYHQIFMRRALRGQQFKQPYLGTRECWCRWRLARPWEDDPASIDLTQDLGLMVYGHRFLSSLSATPILFHARMTKGVVQIPELSNLTNKNN